MHCAVWRIRFLSRHLLITGCATSLVIAGCSANVPAEPCEPASWQAFTRQYPHASNVLRQGCDGSSVAGISFSKMVSTLSQQPNHRQRSASTASVVEQSSDDACDTSTYQINRSSADCTSAVSLKRRRLRSDSTRVYIDNEIRVTRNLNRELSNIHAHLLLQISQYREQLDLFSDGVRERKSNAKIATLYLQARHVLAWAQNQLEISRSNLEVQKQVVSQVGKNAVTDRQTRRSNAELRFLALHVRWLESAIAELLDVVESLKSMKNKD